MENKKEIDLIKQFSFFNITFRFAKKEIDSDIKKRLSKLELLDFKDIKIKYNIEKISIMEEILPPEFSSVPNLTIQIKNFEIFLSKKKISISYPKDLSKSRKRIYSLGRRGTHILPTLEKEKDVEYTDMDLNDLDGIDLFLKIFLIPEILENKIPKLNEISMIFGIDLGTYPNVESLNQIIEESFFKNKKFKFEGLDFELAEDENRFFFTINSDEKTMLCSFVYEKPKFSIFENKIREILLKNFEKYYEIIEELKLWKEKKN